MSSDQPSYSFISIQTGARHNYHIPSVLEKAGKLEKMYTDLCASSGLGALFNAYLPDGFKRGALGRLVNRRPPCNLDGKIITCDFLSLKYELRRFLSYSNLVDRQTALINFGENFGEAIYRKGFGNATHLYSMLGEAGSAIQHAHDQGLKIVVDFYISPLALQIVQQERLKYPDIEPLLPSLVIERDQKRFEEICEIADYFTVPSAFVRKGLLQFGVSDKKIFIVPYFVDNGWMDLPANPKKGRILFVGTAELRKGIHILGMAASILSKYGYDFIVAGGVSNQVRNHKSSSYLKFSGRIPRSEIYKEYAQADIFVLPSLAEGSATVTYEALGAGIPVITTEASGSVVRDKVDGFIVPEKDPKALASAIKELIEDRELRNQMSEAAKQRAQDYTLQKYEQRLLNTLNLM